MATDLLPNRLRALRRESGLTLKEMARILGFSSGVPVSRHEYSETVPNLLTALAYEIIFDVPISTQFSGLYTAVEAGVEQRLTELVGELGQRDAKGRGAAQTARKLVFLSARQQQSA